MNRKYVVRLIGCLGLIISCSGEKGPAAIAGQLSGTCATCHDVGRVSQKQDRKSREREFATIGVKNSAAARKTASAWHPIYVFLR
jgi:hypothetical protein